MSKTQDTLDEVNLEIAKLTLRRLQAEEEERLAKEKDRERMANVIAVVVDDYNRCLGVTPEIMRDAGCSLGAAINGDREHMALLSAALERAYPLDGAES